MKYFHSKKKEFNKEFNKSKVQCFYCHEKGHYAREFYVNKKSQERFHASTLVEEDGPSQKKSSKEKDDDHQKDYLF